MSDANDPLLHYSEIYGSGLFDHSWYLTHYPEVAESRTPGLEHYLTLGRHMGYRPNPKAATPRVGEEAQAAFSAFVAQCKSTELGRRKGTPLVSVVCITYNHENYIEQALRSMLEQETAFEFEVLVGEDCSTDGTAKIVSKVAAEYKNCHAFIRKKNMGPHPNLQDLGRRVRGRYVAMCEGDDYWTDRHKLQRQVEAMERRPDVSVCFHPVRVFYEDSPDVLEFYPAQSDAEPGWDKLTSGNFIQTNSVMYRWRFSDRQPFTLLASIAPGDWFMHMQHLEAGRALYLDRVMAVYRKHRGGIWTFGSDLLRFRKTGRAEIGFFQELEGFFGGLYRSRFVEAKLSILRRLIDDLLLAEDAETLQRVVGWFPELSRQAFAELGYAVQAEALADGAALLEQLRRENMVSVVVTAYKHRASIEQCLAGIAAQRGLFTLQIIVGDDASPDDTVALVQAFAARSPVDIVILDSTQNRGMLANMKRCLKAATGRFVAICEGDDYWLSERKIDKQVRLMRADPSLGLVFNWCLLHFADSDTYLPHGEQGRLQSGVLSFADLAQEPMTANFSSCFYSIEAIKGIPDDYFQSGNSADWLFNLLVADRHRVCFMRDLLSVYTIHTKGQWSGLPPRAQQAAIQSTRRGLAERFGARRGFAPYTVKFRIIDRSSPMLQAVAVANLDQPGEGEMTLADERLVIRGWILAATFETIEVRITSKATEVTRPLNMLRPDVVEIMTRTRDRTGRSDLCGFTLAAPADWTEGLDLSIVVSGQAFPWLRLEVREPASAATADRQRRTAR